VLELDGATKDSAIPGLDRSGWCIL